MYKMTTLFGDEEVKALELTENNLKFKTSDGKILNGWVVVEDDVQMAGRYSKVLFTANDILPIVKVKGIAPVVHCIKHSVGIYTHEELEGTFDALLTQYSTKLQGYADREVPQTPTVVEKLVEYLNMCADLDNIGVSDYRKSKYQLVARESVG